MTSSLDKQIRLEQMIPLILEKVSQGHKVRLYPRGTSMLPLIRQGIDSVELSPLNGPLKKYDLPFYKRDDGQYVLHRIVKAEQTYTCIGDNQTVYEQGVRQDQLLAVVTGFYRKDRYHSVDEFGYKCYLRFWHWTRWIRRYWRWIKGKLKRIGT